MELEQAERLQSNKDMIKKNGKWSRSHIQAYRTLEKAGEIIYRQT